MSDAPTLWRDYRLHEMPEPVDARWTWDQRLPRGQLSFIGGGAGVGKSVLVWALAFSVLTGKPFLDAETEQGPVIYVDFDSDPSTQSLMLHKVRRGMGIRQAQVGDQLLYRVPESIGQSMSRDMLASLRADVERLQPALVIVDAWTSAFYTVRSNDTEQVAAMMGALRPLAAATADGPGPNILIVDHAPKPVQNGPSILERGLIGSTMKLAGSRSAYLLARVPPRDVEGRDVMALHTLKNNLGRLHEPIGVQRVWDVDSVTQTVADLPDEETTAPGIRKAEQAILECLDPQDFVARKDLLLNIVQRANVQQRTALTALARMQQAGAVVMQVDERDRRRKLYRLTTAGPEDED